MESLVSYLGCGKYYSYQTRDAGDFVVQNFSDITNKIIPFLDKYKILGVKAKDYEDWKRAAKIITEKGHLTQPGLDNIRQIRAGMNTGRI